ncbi:hypothetical protein [Rubidibacter lacunae]|nr:hypothetical protein [Rubidibacter lacunae]
MLPAGRASVVVAAIVAKDLANGQQRHPNDLSPLPVCDIDCGPERDR